MNFARRFFITSLLIVISFTLYACGGNENPPIPGNQFTITFNSNGGTSINPISKTEGSILSKPNDPTKDDYNFDGWFLDSQLQTAVNWPITVSSDLSLYAKWSNTVEYFLTARDETINSSQFEYDFNLSVDLSYGPIDGPSAIINGNVKYNSQSTTTYYKYEQNGGLLLPDGMKYTIKTGSDLAILKSKPDGKLYDYEKKSVTNDFKYESSSYAKVLFEYTSEQIQSVNLVSNGKYEVKFKGSATGVINTAISIINNPILAQFLNLPDSDSSLTVYVTYSNDKIDTFEYDFSISLTGATITFHYDMDFVKIGTGVSISVPVFNGVALTTSEVTAKTNIINSVLDNFRTLSNSGYAYDVKTGVDFPGKLEINSHVQGRTMRLIQGSSVYFWNRIEFDSDYKNGDLYNHKGIVDYERYRVMYANGDVYDVTDGFISNTYANIPNYDNHTLDNYYFLIPATILNATNISVIHESVNGTTTNYSIGLNKLGILALIQFIDLSIRVDVNSANEITIFDIESGLEITKCDFNITVENGKLKSISVKIGGAYLSNPYVDTIFTGLCQFKLELNIEVNSNADGYTAPTKNSEVDLSNS
jgi:uncharacterized repeat protein (TIGR02543 family)